MEKIVIRTVISREDAIRIGMTSYGMREYCPTEEDLLSLSEQDRATLAVALRHDGYFACDGVLKGLEVIARELTWETVKPVLVAMLNACRESIAKREAEKEKETLAWLAKTDDELICSPSTYPCQRYAIAGLHGGHADICKDPRVQERMAALRIVVDQKNEESQAAHERQMQMYRAEQEKARLEAEEQDRLEQQQREEARRELRALALEDDSLARAAREGYAVEDTVVQRVINSVRRLAGKSPPLVLSYEDDAWSEDDWKEECEAPDDEEFGEYDRIAAAFAALRKPACMRLTLSRIKSTHLFSPHDDSYTPVVVVTGEHPIRMQPIAVVIPLV